MELKCGGPYKMATEHKYKVGVGTFDIIRLTFCFSPLNSEILREHFTGEH